MREIITIKKWKDRQFIMLDPIGTFKNLARAERIIDKKIFIAHDPYLYKKEFNFSDIPNLEKVVSAYVCLREFFPDLKHVRLEYGWVVCKDFFENGEFIKQRLIKWGDDEFVTEINDVEDDVEELIKDLKQNIIENMTLINTWDGEEIEEFEWRF